GAALAFAGLVGAAAWSRGRAGVALRTYGRMLRSDGGRIVAVLGLGGLTCGGLSALAYMLVLALPQQPWVLTAADSYSHYATLPVGLAIAAALVELGGRVRLAEPVVTMAE